MLKDKRVAFIGTGVSHNDLIKLFLSKGINVVICDKKDEEHFDQDIYEEFLSRGAEFALGEGYLDELFNCDIVFRTPGMYYNNEKLTEVRRAGVVVTSEMETFFDLCPCKTYAITGSDGKTTTTTLVSEFLKAEGRRVLLGGNIGKALLPIIETVSESDCAVVELSSFQLISMRESPDVAGITNIRPNHLNVHKDMNEYIESKRNILYHQNAYSRAVLSLDDETTFGLSDTVRGDLAYFSIKEKPENGSFLREDGMLCYNERGKVTEYVHMRDIKIPGMHNVEDYLTAIAMTYGEVRPETVAKVADTFKLVYTPFHGTGHKLIPEALRRLGIRHLVCVPEQMVIDGNFPTVVSPNPENPEGFYLAVDIAKREGADFILGSDPDADRVGIMVRTKDGEFKVISGNQTGVLLLDYLIGAMKRAGKLPEKATALKTIVTTEMARKVAEVNGLQCFDTFTGFKFMAEKKDQLERAGAGKVIFSYEESYGYMMGDYVRDKDAVTASLILTEMAAWYAAQGKTLADALEELFEKYGHYAEHTYNLVMPGLDGLRDMAELMKSLREAPPAEISGVKVAVRKDYQDGTAVDTATGEKSAMELSGSNVLRFEMADGTSVIVRPSGTEPKIKVYVLTPGKDAADAAANLEKYGKWVDTRKK